MNTLRRTSFLVFSLAIGSMCPGALAASSPVNAAPPMQVWRTTRLALTVLVKDEDQATEAIAEAVGQAGGYVTSRGLHRVFARVPSAKMAPVSAAIAVLGQTAERREDTLDITSDRARLTASVRSKEKMLAQYLGNLKRTNNREDLALVQVASGDLVTEIERGKGALRLMEHEGRFALLDVSFKLRERTSVRASRAPGFPWLSAVDLRGLLYDFSRESGG